MSTTLQTLAADVILAHSTPVQWALSLVSGSVRVICVRTAAASTAGDDITATAHRLRLSCVSTFLMGGIHTIHGHGHGLMYPDSSNIGLKHVAAGCKIEAAVDGDGRDISKTVTGLTVSVRNCSTSSWSLVRLRVLAPIGSWNETAVG